MREMSAELARLGSLTSAELRTEWRKVWKSPAPALGIELLRRGLTWKLQERVHGTLPKSTVRELERIARQIADGKPFGFERTAKPGTRLVRQWRGKTYHVAVLEDGYLFNDRHFASLTQIAQAITGAHWSGPRFFGISAKGGAEVIHAAE